MLLGVIRKASEGVCWGPSGPFSFKDAPPYLFEGFCVFVNGFWVLFQRYLDRFAGALRAPVLFKDSLLFLFGGFWVIIQKPSGFYLKGFEFLFERLLHRFAGALRALLI